MRERETHQKTIEHEVKIHSKTYVKSIQISDSKSDAKKIGRTQTWSSTEGPKPSQILSKIGVEIRYEKRCQARLQRNFISAQGGSTIQKTPTEVTYLKRNTFVTRNNITRPTRPGRLRARSGSKCLRQGSAPGPWYGEFFRRGCLLR